MHTKLAFYKKNFESLHLQIACTNGDFLSANRLHQWRFPSVALPWQEWQELGLLPSAIGTRQFDWRFWFRGNRQVQQRFELHKSPSPVNENPPKNARKKELLVLDARKKELLVLE